MKLSDPSHDELSLVRRPHWATVADSGRQDRMKPKHVSRAVTSLVAGAKTIPALEDLVASACLLVRLYGKPFRYISYSLPV